jgi:hypothetical protein
MLRRASLIVLLSACFLACFLHWFLTYIYCVDCRLSRSVSMISLSYQDAEKGLSSLFYTNMTICYIPPHTTDPLLS